MKRSQLFCETLRQNPADSEAAGHQLLLRGGYVQPLAAGIFSLLPLGQRVRAKVETILREEMDAVGGQEISMPVVQPAELWQETGRWYDVGAALVRFKDRGDRDMVLAMTHEEVVADLLRKHIRSYRQLPIMLYQIQTKFRDEPRARGGLLRVREFVMKDAYSCHTSFEDLDRYYPLVYQSYFNTFRRAGIDVIAVEADVGMMGGTMAHEFIFLTDIGEDQLVLCDSCGYAANRQIATFAKDLPEAEEKLPLEEVETPGTQTIAALAELLGIPESRTAKAAFFMAGERFIFAVIRGDMEVNETKLHNAVEATEATELRPARSDELEAAGIVAGYASPIGLEGVTIVVDDAVARSANLVAGANKPGYHLLNTNFPRDYAADIVTDIAAAYVGARCSVCGDALHLVRGVEVGNIFKLGKKYTKSLGATFLDESGQSHLIVMASYGIGIGRLIACIAEQCRDDRGLIWPVAVAPYHVYLVGLDLQHEDVRRAAERVYEQLQAAGLEVLYDDRAERAGVKFNDADLLGMPLRVTVSRRTLAADSIEIKPRSGGDAEHVSLESAIERTSEDIETMRAQVMSRVTPEVPPPALG
ncbi:MAG: proline--tRNA ligase [Chloroflexota bacterium]